MSEIVRGEASAPASDVDRNTRDEKIEQAKARLGPTPAETRTPPPRKRRWWQRHLEPEERQRILTELGIRRQPHWTFRFTTMLGLSVVVAVMGLSADSAAVVIGAMLLAPLMQPVLATAACISMALFRKSLRWAAAVILASAGSIALSYVLSSLVVNGDLPPEVTSRTAPDIRDLVVALGAGAAGAYATVRKDVSSSLPGVAVAVALVPPLAVVGITLEAGRLTLARGALLLFATNLAAIVLIASIVFVATGFVPPRRLASTFHRTAAVAALVAVVVIAIAVPLFQASRSAAEASEQRLEARAIVNDWLGPIQPADPPQIDFDDRRIQIRVRSFEPPPDDAPLTEAMTARFGGDRVVSLEWERLTRFETTTTVASTTTIVSDAARLRADVDRIVNEWLQEGDTDGARRLDALVIGDGVVRVDASGVGETPPLEDLTARLDEELDETLEVQLTWVERRNVTAAQEPTADELLVEQMIDLTTSWADANELSVIAVGYDGDRATIEIAGEDRPDASDLVDDLEELLPADADIAVLFVERVDITTSTSTTAP